MKYGDIVTLRVEGAHNQWTHEVCAADDENTHNVFLSR